MPKLKPISASEGDSSTPSQGEKLSKPAANSFANPGSMLSSEQPSSDRSGVCTNNFVNSKLTLEKKSHDADKESLEMPLRNNPHDNGLRRPPHLQEQTEKEDAKKHKSHVNFVTAASTKVRFYLFSLFAFAYNITMPKQKKTERDFYKASYESVS